MDADTNYPHIQLPTDNLLHISGQMVAVPKPRMTQRDKWRERPCVLRYRAFKDELMLLARSQGYQVGKMDIDRIDAVVQLPMPKSWSKKKRQAYQGQPHQQKPDADNLLKAICDALLEDDSRVWHKVITKYWGTEGRLDLILHIGGTWDE